MADLQKYMVVHRDPNVPWEKVEENWGKLAGIKSAKWLRTYFNRQRGVRYCLWLAPGSEELERVFAGMKVSYESILDVEETVPDVWGKKWQEHLDAEKKADTLAF